MSTTLALPASYSHELADVYDLIFGCRGEDYEAEAAEVRSGAAGQKELTGSCSSARAAADAGLGYCKLW